MDNLILIGLTGPFGSGCTYVAKKHLEKFGYKYVSLSSILKEEYCHKFDTCNFKRHDLQEFGNSTRELQGNDYFAKKVFEIITKALKEDSSQNKWVIDSIRNTHEIEYFKRAGGQFFLISIWADKTTRWNRVTEKYDNNQNLFDTDDKRDSNPLLSNGRCSSNKRKNIDRKQ